MKQMPTKKRLFGDLGEKMAEMFLVKHDFNILIKNYFKSFGEIDIICEKDGVLHFVEVKSVSRETFCSHFSGHKPEDNVNYKKVLKIKKTANFFMYEKNIKDKTFQIDLITVVFVRGVNQPLITFFENINF